MVPIELFAIFLGLSATLLGIGLVKKTGAIIVCSGVVMLFAGAITDIIILGKIPDTSTVVGDTTTYEFIDNTYTLSGYDRIFMGIVGIFIMLIGALYYRE